MIAPSPVTCTSQVAISLPRHEQRVVRDFEGTSRARHKYCTSTSTERPCFYVSTFLRWDMPYDQGLDSSNSCSCVERSTPVRITSCLYRPVPAQLGCPLSYSSSRRLVAPSDTISVERRYTSARLSDSRDTAGNRKYIYSPGKTTRAFGVEARAFVWKHEELQCEFFAFGAARAVVVLCDRSLRAVPRGRHDVGRGPNDRLFGAHVHGRVRLRRGRGSVRLGRNSEFPSSFRKPFPFID